MNHPHEDQLLLLAYGELPDAADLEAHLASCATCRDTFARLERSRVALDLAVPRARRPARWVAAGLAAAALLVGVMLSREGSRPPQTWQPHQVWSSTAGYVAGGQPLITIDAELTRLEQERTHARP